MWWDSHTPDNTEFVSYYVACEGRIVAVACAGLRVRPTGGDDTYPPTSKSGTPGGFDVEMDLGVGGVLEVRFTVEVVAADGGVYARWTGGIEGGVRGGQRWEGVGLIEEFTV